MIKNASEHSSLCVAFCQLLRQRSISFANRLSCSVVVGWLGQYSIEMTNIERALTYACTCSAINAPATGPGSPDDFLSVAMAIGTGQVPVRRSLHISNAPQHVNGVFPVIGSR